MKKISLLVLVSSVFALTTTGLQAQTVAGLKVVPAQVKPGESTTVTVDLDVKDDRVNCGMRVLFGDGQQQDVKVNQPTDVPIVVKHTYAKAGQYQVKAVPQNMGTTLKCLGKEASAAVAVTAPTVAVAPAPVQNPAARTTAIAPPTGKTMAGPSCPEGFKLDAKSVNKKTGAYSCTAPASSAMPTEKLSCPNELSYFESKKSRRVGCRVE